MQVLTLRATDEIVEAVEKIVASENKNSRRRWDPKEVGRSAVLRHLIALGLEAYEAASREGATR